MCRAAFSSPAVASGMVWSEQWARVTPQARAAAIGRLAGLVQQSTAPGGRLSQLVSEETGCRTSDVKRQGARACSALSFGLERLPELARAEEERDEDVSATGLIFARPHGIVAYSGWHGDVVSDSVAVLGAALLAGNGVVFRAPAAAPETARLIAELAVEAGVPDGLVQVVDSDADLGGMGGVDAFFYRGPRAGAVELTAAAGARDVPVPVYTDVLGGNSVYVDGSADLEDAATLVCTAAFLDCGRHRAAVDRVFVDARVYAPFLNMLATEVRNLRAGPAFDIDAHVGPAVGLAGGSAIDDVVRVVKDAVDGGAVVAAGGQPGKFGSGIYTPTLLADCTERMEIMGGGQSGYGNGDVVVGPVVGVMPVPRSRGDEDLVRLVNQQRHVRSFAWFEGGQGDGDGEADGSEAEAARAAERPFDAFARSHASLALHNRVGVVSPNLPDGFFGTDGLRAFLRRKAVVVE